jgi:hypothetical protein
MTDAAMPTPKPVNNDMKQVVFRIYVNSFLRLNKSAPAAKEHVGDHSAWAAGVLL